MENPDLLLKKNTTSSLEIAFETKKNDLLEKFNAYGLGFVVFNFSSELSVSQCISKLISQS